MSIGWDPKVKPSAGAPPRVAPDATTKAPVEGRAPLLTPEAPLPTAAAAERATTHPSRLAPPAGPALFEKEAARLREQLRADRATRQKAGEQAIAMASRYTLRRARGSRRLGVELMDDVGQAVPDLREAAAGMRALLLAEDELHELTPEGTMSALARLCDFEGRDLSGAGRVVLALAHALTGSALLQAAMHFPELLDELELDAAGAFGRAVAFAEEAIAAAPKQADGHALLGRLVLAHDGEEAAQDAAEVFRHALTLDPEHDAAELGLAAALRELGRLDEARERLDRVHKRGSPRPSAHLLASLIHEDAGELAEATVAMERAVKLAPSAKSFAADLERLRAKAR